MTQFRFEDLEIWEKGIEIGNQLYDIAETLDKKNKYRFAEQLRGAALSISNNIAEGAAGSDDEFKRYLNIARSSIYENANMIKVFESRGYLEDKNTDDLLDQLNHLSRKISAFKESLS